MPISLYDISVPRYIQILDAVGAFMDKGSAYCSESKLDPQQIVETKLHDDMWPFRMQIVSVAHHSKGAIDAIKSGVFLPPSVPDALGYRDLAQMIHDTAAALKKETPDTINAREGKDMVFKLGDRELPFRCEDFITSFSLPNFHFHATTAYDILRMKGVPLGKRHFLGRLEMKK